MNWGSDLIYLICPMYALFQSHDAAVMQSHDAALFQSRDSVP